MHRGIFSSCILLGLLAACTFAPGDSPTMATAMTLQEQAKTSTQQLPKRATSTLLPGVASPTLLSTATLIETATLEPSATPSETPTPEPSFTTTSTDIPEPTSTSTPFLFPTLNFQVTQTATSLPQPAAGSAIIQFFGPGSLSELTSPVTAFGYAVPGYNSRGLIALYGEDGRLLNSEVLQLNAVYTWAYFYWRLPFVVEGAGELARLTMSTKDQFGQLTALSSVHLYLLPEGLSIIQPAGNLKERCVLEQPKSGGSAAGGVLLVSGGMRPFNKLPLMIQLVDLSGNILSSQLVEITPANDDSYIPFQVTLSYSINSGTWARLTLSQLDDLIPGTMYLFSREIWLNP